MNVRFQEYDEKWLYDTKKKKLYEILDSRDCELCKFDMIQLTKFCPFAKVTATYAINPYNVVKRGKS